MSIGTVGLNVTSVIAHAAHPHLPMSPDAAAAALAVGFVVLLAVTYDFYRHEWNGGE